MALIRWNDSFSVNVGKIDAQHRKLVDMLNELHDAMMDGKGRDVLGEILNGMAEYTVVHFSTEEELMQKYNYPGYVKHKFEHDQFVNKVSEFKEKFENGQISAIEVMKYLSEWLKNHILGSDKRLGDFLNSKGVA